MPERIGKAVLTALTAAKPRLRTTVTPNPFQDLLARTMSKRTVDRMIGGHFGLLPRRRLHRVQASTCPRCRTPPLDVFDYIERFCPLLLLSSPKDSGLSGRKVMEWLKRKTSIAGYQISNWIIVLGAIIIVLLIFQNSH